MPIRVAKLRKLAKVSLCENGKLLKHHMLVEGLDTAQTNWKLLGSS